MNSYVNKITAWFLIVWFPLSFTTAVYAQFEDETDESFFTDESVETTESESDPVTEDVVTEDLEETFDENAVVDLLEEPDENLFGPDISEDAVITADEGIIETPSETGMQDPGFELATEPGIGADDRVSAVQNAVLEGIQLSKEPGDTPDESVITCYFIFRDKPTSYFYEAKVKQKTIVFEFNDVARGVSPIESSKESPIQGFRIESAKVDANKEVVGLNPEWHDILKVSFFFDAIPEITVKDEYSVISFSFKWSTDVEKQKDLVMDDGGNKALLFTLIGGGLAVGGLAGVALLLVLNKDPDDVTKKPLEGIEGIINHPDPTNP